MYFFFFFQTFALIEIMILIQDIDASVGYLSDQRNPLCKNAYT